MPSVTAGRLYDRNTSGTGGRTGGGTGNIRPYAAAVAWNTPLDTLYPASLGYASGPPVHVDSSMFLSLTHQNKGQSPNRAFMGSDPTLSTLPIYYMNEANKTQIQLRYGNGGYSWRYGNDNSVSGIIGPGLMTVDAPGGAMKADNGPDDYYITWRNTDTGEEYCAWHTGCDSTGWNSGRGANGLAADGTWFPQDFGDGRGLAYNCASFSRYQPDPANGTSGGVGGWINGAALPSFAFNPKQWNQRGSKIPENVGLVQPWEIAQGHIDHAIAYAFHGPGGFTFPAQNSDGTNFGGAIYDPVTRVGDMPEGARVFLRRDFDLTLFSTSAARIIGQTMKDYGLICIDNTGNSKIYLESYTTADWASVGVNPATAYNMMAAATVATDYRVVDWTAAHA